jgi:hypothetical protein
MRGKCHASSEVERRERLAGTLYKTRTHDIFMSVWNIRGKCHAGSEVE